MPQLVDPNDAVLTGQNSFLTLHARSRGHGLDVAHRRQEEAAGETPPASVFLLGSTAGVPLRGLGTASAAAGSRL